MQPCDHVLIEVMGLLLPHVALKERDLPSIVLFCYFQLTGLRVRADCLELCSTREQDRRRAGRVAQVVGHLPSKCEAMSSNSSTTTKKKKKQKDSDKVDRLIYKTKVGSNEIDS
jgi:hypothetical protein